MDIVKSNLGGLSMDVISSFSSIGPTPDGRIKPDILAPGNSIYSVAARSENSEATDSDCALEWKAGTSMSTPVAAANALLIRYPIASVPAADGKRSIVSSGNAFTLALN